MPKQHTPYQQPMEIFEAVKDLNESNGIPPFTLDDDMTFINLDKRINLARLAMLYGRKLGPLEGVGEDYDYLLDVVAADFENASPDSINAGLFIAPDDPRYHDPLTERLVRTGNFKGDNPLWGVVFPQHQFSKVSRSPRGLTEQGMDKTREANSGEDDLPKVDATVGRTGGHIMERYIPQMEKVDKEIEIFETEILDPLTSQTRFNWQAHYKARNLDNKYRYFVEEMHGALDTASLNLNIDTTALRGAHRALASRLSRQRSTKEQNEALKPYLKLSKKYAKGRRDKVGRAIQYAQENLDAFQPFLDAKTTEDEAGAQLAMPVDFSTSV
jgi:hypothetical protein